MIVSSAVVGGGSAMYATTSVAEETGRLGDLSLSHPSSPDDDNGLCEDILDCISALDQVIAEYDDPVASSSPSLVTLSESSSQLAMASQPYSKLPVKIPKKIRPEQGGKNGQLSSQKNTCTSASSQNVKKPGYCQDHQGSSKPVGVVEAMNRERKDSEESGSRIKRVNKSSQKSPTEEFSSIVLMGGKRPATQPTTPSEPVFEIQTNNLRNSGNCISYGIIFPKSTTLPASNSNGNGCSNGNSNSSSSNITSPSSIKTKIPSLRGSSIVNKFNASDENTENSKSNGNYANKTNTNEDETADSSFQNPKLKASHSSPSPIQSVENSASLNQIPPLKSSAQTPNSNGNNKVVNAFATITLGKLKKSAGIPVIDTMDEKGNFLDMDGSENWKFPEVNLPRSLRRTRKTCLLDDDERKDNAIDARKTNGGEEKEKMNENDKKLENKKTIKDQIVTTDDNDEGEYATIEDMEIPALTQTHIGPASNEKFCVQIGNGFNPLNTAPQIPEFFSERVKCESPCVKSDVDILNYCVENNQKSSQGNTKRINAPPKDFDSNSPSVIISSNNKNNINNNNNGNTFNSNKKTVLSINNGRKTGTSSQQINFDVDDGYLSMINKCEVGLFESRALWPEEFIENETFSPEEMKRLSIVEIGGGTEENKTDYFSDDSLEIEEESEFSILSSPTKAQNQNESQNNKEKRNDESIHVSSGGSRRSSKSSERSELGKMEKIVMIVKGEEEAPVVRKPCAFFIPLTEADSVVNGAEGEEKNSKEESSDKLKRKNQSGGGNSLNDSATFQDENELEEPFKRVIENGQMIAQIENYSMGKTTTLVDINNDNNNCHFNAISFGRESGRVAKVKKEEAFVAVGDDEEEVDEPPNFIPPPPISNYSTIEKPKLSSFSDEEVDKERIIKKQPPVISYSSTPLRAPSPSYTSSTSTGKNNDFCPNNILLQNDSNSHNRYHSIASSYSEESEPQFLRRNVFNKGMIATQSQSQEDLLDTINREFGDKRPGSSQGFSSTLPLNTMPPTSSSHRHRRRKGFSRMIDILFLRKKKNYEDAIPEIEGEFIEDSYDSRGESPTSSISRKDVNNFPNSFSHLHRPNLPQPQPHQQQLFIPTTTTNSATTITPYANQNSPVKTNSGFFRRLFRSK